MKEIITLEKSLNKVKEEKLKTKTNINNANMTDNEHKINSNEHNINNLDASFTDKLYFKKSKDEALINIDSSAKIMANEIGLALSVEVDELNSNATLFKQGMERCCSLILTAIAKKEEPFLIFPESIPGFTAMSFKKAEHIEINVVARNPVEEVKQFSMVNIVLNNFFKKNNGKVLLIENKDIILIFLPINDMKRSLKEMDLYITY